MFLCEIYDNKPIKTEVNNTNVFEKSYDIIVAGLGTAGAICLITAAKKGLSALGIEQLGNMGGATTFGAIYNYYGGVKGGIYQSLEEEAKKLAENESLLKPYASQDLCRAIVLEKACDESGADYIYNSCIIGVYIEENRIVGVRYFGCDGIIHNIACKILADCSADALICAMAACELRNGRQAEKPFQPYSKVLVYYSDSATKIAYTDNGFLNQYNAFEYGKEVLISSSSIPLFKEYYSEQARTLFSASLLGVREGKTVVGEESLIFEEFLHGRITEEPAFYAYSNLDKHGKDFAFEDRLCRDWIIVCGLWACWIEFPVPKGTMIAKGVEGLLVAGRHISVDQNFSFALRMKDDMQKSGEAAAIIAYLSLKNNCSPKNVSYNELKSCLQQTACIKESDRIRFSLNSESELKWLEDTESIKKALSSESSGFAVYSAYLCLKNGRFDILKALQEWVYGKEELLKKNSALALGLFGDLTCEPCILEMIKDKSAYSPNTSKQCKIPHAVSAISIVGKLGLVNAVDTLIDIITNKNYIDSIALKLNIITEAKDELYFIFFSNAMTALLEIAKKHTELQEQILSGIENVVFDENFTLPINLYINNYKQYDMAEQVKFIIRDYRNDALNKAFFE